MLKSWGWVTYRILVSASVPFCGFGDLRVGDYCFFLVWRLKGLTIPSEQFQTRRVKAHFFLPKLEFSSLEIKSQSHRKKSSRSTENLLR